MQRQRKKFIKNLFISSLLLIVGFFAFVQKANASEEYDFEDNLLILEPVVQQYPLDDYAYVYTDKKDIYISLAQLSSYIGLKYTLENQQIVAEMADDPDTKMFIDVKEHKASVNDKDIEFSSKDYLFLENTYFFKLQFLERLLDISIESDILNMQLKINREKDFPSTVLRKAKANRSNGFYEFSQDSFKDYDFDNRLFAEPVADLTLSKGWSHSKSGKTGNSDAYTLNLAALAMGLDVNTYVSGNITGQDTSTVRIYGSRTFLDEPGNSLNLKTLKVGDINGVNQSFFTRHGSGRGAAFSSFKDLVMSADKTIDITGPLQEGWEVELYWNDQLVGYRQNGTNGQYNFPNMPVSYGLNTFKLVFYGPYGETRTEYERYYSGTSPVKKNEFGYNLSVYQPDRYLVETENDNLFKGTKDPVADLIGYYGLTDKTTVMFGLTQTPGAHDTFETQHFAMAGAQLALQGSSLQYNLEQNIESGNFGHHLDWQGDVYVGNLYAAYDKYNSLHSPVSSFGDEYLKEQREVRFSSVLPNHFPYYVSYKEGRLENNDLSFKNLSGRVSKQVGGLFNLSLEDSYYKYENVDAYNEIKLDAYKYWGKVSSETWLVYQTMQESRFTEFLTRVDWRAGRNTYITGKYKRDLVSDMDYLSLSAGQLFDFGGLTITIEADRDENISVYLTYNISFAREPERLKLVTSADSKLSSTGSIHVKAIDENGKPLEGVGIDASGLEKEVYTDKNGAAVLRDLPTYEKVIMTMDPESMDDVALQPEQPQQKMVLRPGTIRSVTMPFIHCGAIEGKLENSSNRRMFGYKIAVHDKDGKEVASTFADLEGYFVLDGVPYGEYSLVITKDGRKLANVKKIVVDDVVVYVNGDIVLAETYVDGLEAENIIDNSAVEAQEQLIEVVYW